MSWTYLDQIHIRRRTKQIEQFPIALFVPGPGPFKVTESLNV